MKLDWPLHTEDPAEVERDSWTVPNHKPQPTLGLEARRFGGLEGGLAFGTTWSLGSFGRGVCFCGLAAIVPGLPGALKCLCPLLVHNHVVNTLIWYCHASSIAFHLRGTNTQKVGLSIPSNLLPLIVNKWFRMWGMIDSYLPRWGRLAGVKIQIQVLHLFVSFRLHHRAAPTIRSHGRTKLHVLHKPGKVVFIDNRGTLRKCHSKTKLIS